jgi:hypothetical protein
MLTGSARIRRWLEEDDALILKEDNGRDMQTEEKRLVLAARGL